MTVYKINDIDGIYVDGKREGGTLYVSVCQNIH